MPRVVSATGAVVDRHDGGKVSQNVRGEIIVPDPLRRRHGVDVVLCVVFVVS